MSWLDTFFNTAANAGALAANSVQLLVAAYTNGIGQLTSQAKVKWQVGADVGYTLSDAAEATYSDAAQHTLYTFPLPNGTTLLKVSVAGTKTDTTASGGREGYLVARNNNGVITTDVAWTDTIATWGAWTATVSVSGTNVVVQVTGVNAVRWRAEVQAQVYP